MEELWNANQYKMPILYIIAGPNGIGKTTSSFDIAPKNVPLINSDEIAKEARSTGLISGNTQEYSNHEASRLVNEELNNRNSFAIETNLADVETWKFLIEVQRIGYKLYLKYISITELRTLNDRIAERVLLGEHYVRPDIVEQRYISGLKLLSHYFAIPDKLELFDNSKNMKLVAEARNGKVIFTSDNLPQWVKTYLGSNLNTQSKQIETSDALNNIDLVRMKYQALKEKYKNNS